MTLRARLQAWAMGLAVLLAALAGGWVGTRLGHSASAPHIEYVSVIAPEALTGPPADAARSPGGFTGFGGPPALRGEVQRSGPVLRVESGLVVVGPAESSASVRYTSPERLFRIAPATTPVRAGDLVQIRVKDGQVTGILRLPPNLEQGTNRPK